MKVSTLCTLTVVLGFQMANGCPPNAELESKVQYCLREMMMFVEAEDSERLSKCPNLREGVDCVDELLEACKDNPALQDHYSMLKNRLAESRQDFNGFCGSAIAASSSFVLILSACLLSLWFWK